MRNTLSLPEGIYKLAGGYTSNQSKIASSQRVTKSCYIKAQAVRAHTPTVASPASKSKNFLGLSKKFSSSTAAPTPPPPVATGQSVEYYVYPSGDSVCVCQISSADRENATKEKRFPADPTSCSINTLTSTVDCLETLVGFESGEILLIDSISFNQLCKFNSGSSLNQSRVTDLCWIPGSSNMFVAAFGNGMILVFDRDKDDSQKGGSGYSLDSTGKPDTHFFVHHPKTSKSNPVARWHVGKGPVNHVCFSHDTKMMCVCCHDGHARIFDFTSEKLLFSFRSHYGAILCAAWSPDSQVLVTGGEDDLVVAWSIRDKCPIVRCNGHTSWISSIAFDAELCDPEDMDDGNYRFHSVAQDGRLCSWDLCDRNMIFTRKRTGAKSRNTSFASPPAQARVGAAGSLVCEVPRADEIASLAPTSNALIDTEPLSSLAIAPQCLITSCFSGEVKIWSRPNPASPKKLPRSVADADDDD